MGSTKTYSIVKDITKLVEPILEEIGFELVDVEYLSGQGKWILRLYIDKEGGITVGDCAFVSREIGYLIDVKDIIKNEYTLEVSSPGLDRPLKKEKDFYWAIDKKIKVKMRHPVNGRRNFTGILKNYYEGSLLIQLEKEQVTLSCSGVERANLVYEF